MQIKKVLNSSVVLVSDNGVESILLGKGIGYGRKPGQEINRQPTDRLFVPLTNPEAQRMVELFDSIPEGYLDVTQDIVRDAEQTLNTTLSPHIYAMLTDHLHFAVERMQKGIVVTNKVYWEIRQFYPQEFAVGRRGLDRMQKKLGVLLPDEEAANIAFHIVNANKDEAAHFDAMKAAKLIGTIMSIVTYTMRISPDADSIHYTRFINHLQFFADRFYSGKLLDSEDDFLYHQMQHSYPQAIQCAEKVRTQLLRTENCFLPNEEVAYLALHIARLTAAKD